MGINIQGNKGALFQEKEKVTEWRGGGTTTTDSSLSRNRLMIRLVLHGEIAQPVVESR
jgi:hypothetical protein